MIRILFFAACFFTSSILCDENEEDEFEVIGDKANLVNPNNYFAEVMQEMIYELEDRGWSTMKANDVIKNMNDITHTNLAIVGHANYTNGFLVSIQKIDVSDMGGSTTSSIEEIDDRNVTVTTGIIRGRINFRDLRIGHDVSVQLANEDQVRKYTGYFPYTLYQIEFTIRKNLNFNQFTTSASLTSMSGGSGVRMQYLPDDEISQVMSMGFASGDNWSTGQLWMNGVMLPLITDLINNKIDFPQICFNC